MDGRWQVGQYVSMNETIDWKFGAFSRIETSFHHKQVLRIGTLQKLEYEESNINKLEIGSSAHCSMIFGFWIFHIFSTLNDINSQSYHEKDHHKLEENVCCCGLGVWERNKIDIPYTAALE